MQASICLYASNAGGPWNKSMAYWRGGIKKRYPPTAAEKLALPALQGAEFQV
jgi:hypothetical protein